MPQNTSTTPVDEFDDARGSEFVRPEDVDGRAIVVWATETGTATGDNGKEYDWVQVDFIALDGDETEKVTPGEINEIRFTSSQIVGQLKRKVGNGRPTLGRVDSRKSRFRTPAYGFQPVDANDPIRAKASAAVAKYNEARSSADPFAV